MRPHWLLKKKSIAHAGVTHVSIFMVPSRCLSATNTRPKNRARRRSGSASGQRMYIHHDGSNGRAAKPRDMNGRWNTDSSSVPCARKTVSGGPCGTALPDAALSKRSHDLGSRVPYIQS